MTTSHDLDVTTTDRTPRRSNPRLRVALVADLLEEGWPSMDLVADMIAAHAPAVADGAIELTTLRAPFTRRLPLGAGGDPRTIDRIVNRFWDYPRWLARRAGEFDVFHVADHSYAHLVHVLPAERTVAFCHDADAFRAFFGDGEDGSLLPRFLTRRVLEGLRRAARVFCISDATRQALSEHRLVDASRLQVVALGVHPACSPEADPAADAKARALVGDGGTDLLHVGSTIPRKRIDLLLRVLAAVRDVRPDVRLVRVGGLLTPEQDALARDLDVRAHVVDVPFVDRSVLAAVYRRAAVVLLTSEREGFGLPIVEALACGTPVVASDLAVCREVGGDAVIYRALDPVSSWTEAVLEILDERDRRPDAWMVRRRLGVDRAARFSWRACAEASVATYLQLAGAAKDSTR